MGSIFTLLMKFIVSIVNFFLSPVNELFVGLFPDFTDKINYFESLVNRYVTPLLGWFFHLLPPHTSELIILYLELLISFYFVSVAVHGTIKVIEIIKDIKIW